MMDEYDFFLRIVWERKEQRKEERKRGDTPLFYNETLSFFLFDSCIYLSSSHFITLHSIVLMSNSTTLPWAFFLVVRSTLLCLALST